MWPARPIFPVLLIGCILTGCATSQGTVTGTVYDPWEDYNRGMFETYLVLDRTAFRPAAEAWRDVPKPVRTSLFNLVLNLDGPDIFINDMLRGRVGPAGTTLLRLAINSTIGIGGLFEVAQRFGLPRHSDDFGKTLAEYGVSGGPYTYQILFGPANVRDLAGTIVDLALNPLLFIAWPADIYLLSGDVGMKTLDRRERNLELWDEVRSSSVDPYAKIRDAYTQFRSAEIRREMGGKEDLPEF